MKRHVTITALALALAACTSAPQPTDWPAAGIETRPASRWWWMGSAVDSADIAALMQQYADAGFGALEITPIYGVRGNDSADISFLSPQWMRMLDFSIRCGRRHGINIDMNTGTGWPFGGPTVGLDDAARKMLFGTYEVPAGGSLADTIAPADPRQRRTASLMRLMAYAPDGRTLDLTDRVDSARVLRWTAPEGSGWKLIAVFCGHTFQKVKRAAPGGEGFVVDHFSAQAVARYLDRFAQAFDSGRQASPHHFFNDSYEVYGADCTPDFFERFEELRGYRLQDYLPQFLGPHDNDTTIALVTDYRQTISDLLLSAFTRQWTDWAHRRGSLTRNQAHGSPANLIDIYAAVDIPECEGFGLTDFGISGLRTDSLVRRNDSDLSMLKYASSAAHIAGKAYTSSETFTWLTEHFRTSLSQCKPDLDLMFVSGVNHVCFHGTTYSPPSEPWPGRKFYASVDMSPTNPQWRDMRNFSDYISRSQSFLQMGRPDNDLLVYLPLYDIWQHQPGHLVTFSIHEMAQRAPGFIAAVDSIMACGHDVDYVSDAFVRTLRLSAGGRLVTSGDAEYKAIIVPGAEVMPHDVLEHLLRLARSGATVIFAHGYPRSVPGFGRRAERQSMLKATLMQLPEVDFGRVTVSPKAQGRIITGSNYADLLAATGIAPETMKSRHGLHFIRRRNNTGYHYFVANLTPHDLDTMVTLSTPARSAMLYDPMTGRSGSTPVAPAEGGRAAVRLQLLSGQSVVLRTYTTDEVSAPAYASLTLPESARRTIIGGGWQVSFEQSSPAIADTFATDTLCAWTSLPDERCRVNMGTAVYTTTFDVDTVAGRRFVIDLGDVRESASLSVNGRSAGTLWAVPFRCDVTGLVRQGTNSIEVRVTGLPANRIAQMDRDGVEWRRFKEINIVNIHYRREGYAHWPVTTAGLIGPVSLLTVPAAR